MRTVANRITSTWWAVTIVIVALAGALAVVGAVGEATRTPTSVDSLPIGSDSAQALKLREKLPQAQGSTAVVLYTKTSGSLSADDLAALQKQFVELPDAGRAPLQKSDDGSAAVGVVPVDSKDAVEAGTVVTALRAAAKAGLPQGVTAAVTGPAAIQADLGAVFKGANVRLLISTASIVAILLVITYRSPTLWVVPLVVVGVADRLASVVATHTLSAFGVTWDESTIGILSVLVFGAGTDYALLLISRYRDELRHHENRREAMALALHRTAEAVLSSAVTVVLGLLTLLLSVFPATRGLGLACAVGVVVAAAFVLIVLPAALVLFGRWIFWPKVPHVGSDSLADGRSLWRRVGDRVAAHPKRFVAVTLVVLAAMAGGVGFISVGLSQSDQFISKPEAITAATRLAESFPAGSADPAIIVTTAAPDAVKAAAEAVPGIASARVNNQSKDADAIRSLTGLSELSAVITAAPGSERAGETVRALRAALVSLPRSHVAGTDAVALDQDEASARDRAVVLPLLVLLVLLALGVLLRSVVAPVVLVTTVLATYLASLGASWWIFTKIFGFSGLDNNSPLFAFVFLVALGVDYNIFLVTRASEESRTHGAHEGMLRALAATGGVITSAGVLLAAVFAVLGVLPLVALAQIGVIICIGVLLDTLLVRTILVPAIALLLGETFWWPRRVTPGRHAEGHPRRTLATQPPLGTQGAEEASASSLA